MQTTKHKAITEGRNRGPRRRGAFAILAVLGFALTGCDDPDEVVVAEAGSVWWNAPMFLAHDYFEDEGLSVNSFDVASGLESKNAVAAGNATFGVVASTPLINAAARDEDIVILASYMSSDRLVGLVHPSDMTAVEALSSPIAYTKGTISEFYLRKFMETEAPEQDFEALNLVSVPPPGTLPAIVNDDVVAASAFEPFSTLIVRQSADAGRIVEIDNRPGLYEVRSYIVTSGEFYENNPEIAEAFAEAYRQAIAYIGEQPQEARSRMVERFSFPEGFLDGTWEDVRFEFVTDRGVILNALLAEAEVAEQAGMLGNVTLTESSFEDMLRALP